MFGRVRGLFGASDAEATVINVKWNRERLVVPLKDGLRVPLSALRASLAERTSLAPDAFKLIHKGAVLKDDSALLTAYGIAPGATLQLLEAGPAPQQPQKAPKAPATEEGTVAAIRAELESVASTLQPGVDAFLSSLSGTPAPTSTSTASAPQPIATVRSVDAVAAEKPVPAVLANTKTLADQHTRLGELLLQALLRLDAIGIEGGWADARAERKAAVRHVQGVLDKVDGAWRERQGGAGG